MKKLLFNNDLFFPDLTPPNVIFFKDIVYLLLLNGFRTFLCALTILILLTPVTIIDPFYSDEKIILAIISFIYLLILGIYFLLSIFYTFKRTTKWYKQYLKNFSKIDFIKEYKQKTENLEKELKAEYLKAKLENQNLDKNLEEEYLKKEDNIYENLKKNYKAKFIKKMNSDSSSSIDNNIQKLENEFSELITRKTDFSF